MALFSDPQDREFMTLLVRDEFGKGIKIALDEHLKVHHEPIDGPAGRFEILEASVGKLQKFKSQILAIIGFIGFIGTLAWGELKGLIFHGH